MKPEKRNSSFRILMLITNPQLAKKAAKLFADGEIGRAHV